MVSIVHWEACLGQGGLIAYGNAAVHEREFSCLLLDLAERRWAAATHFDSGVRLC